MQGGYAPVGAGPIGPGLGGFPRIYLLGFSVNRGNLLRGMEEGIKLLHYLLLTVVALFALDLDNFSI